MPGAGCLALPLGRPFLPPFLLRIIILLLLLLLPAAIPRFPSRADISSFPLGPFIVLSSTPFVLSAILPTSKNSDPHH